MLSRDEERAVIGGLLSVDGSDEVDDVRLFRFTCRLLYESGNILITC